MNGRCITLALLSAVVLLVCLAGCTGGQDGGTPAPTETVTATLSPETGNAVTLYLSAENIAFNRSEISVPAGSTVTIEFDNRDAGIRHNFALYETEAAENAIFRGEIITGPAEITYTFTAPDTPGTYVFLCDLHPQQMRGAFVVV